MTTSAARSDGTPPLTSTRTFTSQSTFGRKAEAKPSSSRGLSRMSFPLYRRQQQEGDGNREPEPDGAQPDPGRQKST